MATAVYVGPLVTLAIIGIVVFAVVALIRRTRR